MDGEEGAELTVNENFGPCMLVEGFDRVDEVFREVEGFEGGP